MKRSEIKVWWNSEIIKGLWERGFLRKEKGGRKIRLSNNYETGVLLPLLNEFSLEKLFCGKKEFILRSLPKSVARLEKQFSKSFIYQRKYKRFFEGNCERRDWERRRRGD